MTKYAITPQQHLTVVKHLASGKALDVVATITKLDRDQVLDIGSKHGYPDTDKLAWAVDILTKKLDAEQTKSGISTEDTSPSGVKLAERPAAQAATPLRSAPAPADDIKTLLHKGKDASSKRLQKLADRILDDVAQLREQLKAEEAKAAERRKKVLEKAEAKAEVDRLRQQLREAEAKLRGSETTPTSDGPSAKQVRAWATSAGVDCPATGRVPKSVREAYDQAHTAAAS